MRPEQAAALLNVQTSWVYDASKAIAQANKEMEKAAKALAKGNPEAIEHYKQAWKRVIKP